MPEPSTQAYEVIARPFLIFAVSDDHQVTDLRIDWSDTIESIATQADSIEHGVHYHGGDQMPDDYAQAWNAVGAVLDNPVRRAAVQAVLVADTAIPRPIEQDEYSAMRDYAAGLVRDGVEPGTIIDAIRDELEA